VSVRKSQPLRDAGDIEPLSYKDKNIRAVSTLNVFLTSFFLTGMVMDGFLKMINDRKEQSAIVFNFSR